MALAEPVGPLPTAQIKWQVTNHLDEYNHLTLPYFLLEWCCLSVRILQ